MRRAATVALAGVGFVAAWAGPVRAADTAVPTAITTAALAAAASVDPHDTALVGQHRYQVGIFRPLTLRLAERLELRGHPLLFLIAPNAVLRVGLQVQPWGWTLASEYGLSVPTLAMRLSQGYLFPSWERGGGTVGWAAAPRLGLLASRRLPGDTWLTIKADLTVGVPLSHTDATPLDAPAPLELLLAPVLSGARARFGTLVERPFGARVRLRVYGDLYLRGRTPILQPPARPVWSNVTTRLGVGVDFLPGAQRRNRITVGVAWWNSDQHAIDEATFERVRTNEVWPTVDFVWGG